MNFDDLHERTRKLREENDQWAIEFNHICKLRENAKQLEKAGQYSSAIGTYLQSIQYGELSSRIVLNHYIHDINRVIILYGKLKMKSEQKAFLERVISEYPKSPDKKNWKLRLKKLK